MINEAGPRSEGGFSLYGVTVTFWLMKMRSGLSGREAPRGGAALEPRDYRRRFPESASRLHGR